MYRTAAATLERHHRAQGRNPQAALQALWLDEALSPRHGGEHTLQSHFGYDAHAVQRALAAMELPPAPPELAGDWTLQIHHPGGVGEILHSAEGGSWLGGSITLAQPGAPGAPRHENASECSIVALA